MNPPGLLAGKTIVVTRPRAQAGPLAAAIAAQGGQPLIFPLLEISQAADAQPLVDAVARLAAYSLAIFISPNAVDYAVPAILAQGPWPASLLPAGVGQGTVKALAAHGISGCIAPSERFDSETLLALPELAAERVAGRRVAIFRGDGGRELLAHWAVCLMMRGRRSPSWSVAMSGVDATLLDLLDAARTSRTIQQSYIEALFNYQRNVIQLESAVGQEITS